MYSFFRFTQVGVLASLFAWALLAGICNIQSHTKIDYICRTFSEGSPSNSVKKKGFCLAIHTPSPLQNNATSNISP